MADTEFQFDSHRLFLFIIICSSKEQVGDFFIRSQTDCGIFMELSLPTIGAAVGQRGAFKAVVAGIAVIEIQVCSPRSFSVFRWERESEELQGDYRNREKMYIENMTTILTNGGGLYIICTFNT